MAKPWGHELIWAETDRYAGKILHIKAGHKLSRQFHRKKDETIYLLSGALVVELGDRQLQVEPGDCVVIPATTVHRMVAKVDSDVLEASSPELDDVVRLDDEYGRAGTAIP